MHRPAQPDPGAAFTGCLPGYHQNMQLLPSHSAAFAPMHAAAAPGHSQYSGVNSLLRSLHAERVAAGARQGWFDPDDDVDDDL